jgi:spectinomycin phosphotransferase
MGCTGWRCEAIQSHHLMGRDSPLRMQKSGVSDTIMLEKPDIQDTTIMACLRDEYGLNVVRVAFLPLGADGNTAVYRAITDSAASYFVKLRGGDFDEMTIAMPKLLHDQGIQHVIPPLSTRSGRLWADLRNFKLSVFPFVEGRDGYEADLLDQHWIDFGRALKAIHTAQMPSDVIDRIQREVYSARWREIVRKFQRLVEDRIFSDPVSAELAAFLKDKRGVIGELIQRAEDLAAVLQTQSQPFILCHADIHAGNILIGANGRLYIVDWDTLTFAPKERDLMYAGGGLFGNWRSPQEEEALFYQGYGPTQVDGIVLAYYRYERIVQDVAAYCEQIVLTDGGGQDRANGLRQLTDQFLPNGVVEIAFHHERDF